MAIHVLLTNNTERLAGYFAFLGTVLLEGIFLFPSIDLGKKLSRPTVQI